MLHKLACRCLPRTFVPWVWRSSVSSSHIGGFQTTTGINGFDYRSPRFSVRERLVYDPTGLVPDYPGIGVRVH
jgi:hypothetical protein